MTGDDSKVGQPRTQGKLIENVEPEVQTKRQRTPRTFDPGDIPEPGGPPEPIPGAPSPSPDEPFLFHLTTLPIKGLKPLLVTLAMVIVIMLGFEVYNVTLALKEIHFVLAAGFLVLLALVFLFGIRAVVDYIRNPEVLEGLDLFREEAKRLRYSRDKGRAEHFIKTFRGYYHGKPQETLLEQCVQEIKKNHDYYDDSEVIAYLERRFLQKLDEMAAQRISHHCLQTGTAIAISPWAIMDVGLALWRNTTLLREIAAIYGVRPSLRNRYKLLKHVAKQMALVGGTQLLMDSAMDGMASVGAGVPVMASFAQGVGAAIYTAKIGVAAMQVTRPIQFKPEDRPSVQSLVSPTIDEIKRRLLKLAGIAQG